MPGRWRLLIVLAALGAPAPAATAAEDAALHARTTPASGAPRPAQRVLFIGNSYLYTNDLPQLVAALAQSHGARLDTGLRAEPDFGLSDHLRDHRLRAALAQRWDWIVLQQGPSSLPQNRAALIENVRRFRRRIDAADRARRAASPRTDATYAEGAAASATGAAAAGRVAKGARRDARVSPDASGRTRIALMAAWPPQPHAALSPEAELSYRLAAEAIDACVLPVAAAWRIARESGEVPTLYQADELHPTRAGSLLAAMAMLPGLIDLRPGPLVQPPADADAAERARLQLLESAARLAHEQEARHCEP